MKQQVFLSSRHASTYNNGTYHSDITFNLTKPITRPRHSKNTILRVEMFECPVSFYTIDATNNKLYINGVETTIPTGNYNAESLRQALTNLVAFEAVAVTYDAATNKYTFTAAFVDFTLDAESTCFSVIGFTEGQDHTSNALSLTSEYQINLTSNPTLYIDLPDFGNPNICSYTKRATGIVASIPTADATGGWVFYDNLKRTQTSLMTEDSISTLHVRVLGKDQTTPIDLQNHHWAMTLEFEFEV